jgi:hypothetical protein
LIWMGDGKEWPGLAVMLHHRDCSDRKPECYEEIEHGPGRWRVLRQGEARPQGDEGRVTELS